jgi:tRNA-uridine 2-sulfurtransferase
LIRKKNGSVRCIALLSGGLDSVLAIRIMQEQGVEVEALNFKTIFTCCQDQSAQAARDLDVPLTVLAQEDDYLDIIKRPQFGYGKGANPCIDCRIYMFDRAKAYMEESGADFIISGEVVGQRPMSQKKKDLKLISNQSDLEDVLLRPLSAKLLSPTLPEREGWVDRQKLYDFHGRSRKGLIQLANQLGVTEIPAPSTGCALTEQIFSKKIFDLVVLEPDGGRWQYELVKYGRHFRFDQATKVVVGRNEADNNLLRYAHEQVEGTSSLALIPKGFQGPVALLVGPETPEAMKFAQGLMMRYSKVAPHENTETIVERREQEPESIFAEADIDVADVLPITNQ